MVEKTTQKQLKAALSTKEKATAYLKKRLGDLIMSYEHTCEASEILAMIGSISVQDESLDPVTLVSAMPQFHRLITMAYGEEVAPYVIEKYFDGSMMDLFLSFSE